MESVVGVSLVHVFRWVNCGVDLAVRAIAHVIIGIVNPIDVGDPAEACPVLINDTAKAIEAGVGPGGPLKMVEFEGGLRILAIASRLPAPL